jgi:hypothetical protein
MGLLYGIPNPEDGPFFTTMLEIAAENLKDAKALQLLKFIPKGEGGKSQQRKDIVVNLFPLR